MVGGRADLSLIFWTPRAFLSPSGCSDANAVTVTKECAMFLSKLNETDRFLFGSFSTAST